LFVFERIEHLSGDLARDALVEPAAAESVAWDPDAVTFVVAETSGYPYFLQQFGQDTWNDAPGPRLTLTDAHAGAAKGLVYAPEHGVVASTVPGMADFITRQQEA
jgi:hypothetical protein